MRVVKLAHSVVHHIVHPVSAFTVIIGGIVEIGEYLVSVGEHIVNALHGIH